MIGANLLRYNDTREFLGFDLEGSGLTLCGALPTQVSFATFTLKKDIEIVDRYIYWSEADLRMSRGAAAVTRFNRAQYEERAEDPRKVLEMFEDNLYSKSKYPVGHNILGYDSMLINNWRRKLGLKPRYDYLVGHCYDTNALYKAYKLNMIPDLSSDINFLAWQYKSLSYYKQGFKSGISTALKEFKICISEDELHEASTDTIAVKEIFRQIVWKLEI